MPLQHAFGDDAFQQLSDLDAFRLIVGVALGEIIRERELAAAEAPLGLVAPHRPASDTSNRKIPKIDGSQLAPNGEIVKSFPRRKPFLLMARRLPADVAA